MAERYRRQKPEYLNQVNWIRENFDTFAHVVDLAGKIDKIGNEIDRLQRRPIPIADAVELLKIEQSLAREQIEDAHLTQLIWAKVTKSRMPWDAGFDADRGRRWFVDRDESALDRAAKNLIEPDNVLSDADQAKEKKRLEKEKAAAISEIKKFVPDDILQPFTGNDFFRSVLWVAFVHWQDLQRTMNQACDPYGALMTEENPFKRAYEYLNLASSIGTQYGARYQPAPFDLDWYR